MSKPGESQTTWIQGGAALSLGWLAWAVYRKRWFAARIGFHLAAAFISKWGDLRLQARVQDLLGRAEKWDGNGDPPFNPVDSWRTA